MTDPDEVVRVSAEHDVEFLPARRRRQRSSETTSQTLAEQYR
jgi:hypothetical protein